MSRLNFRVEENGGQNELIVFSKVNCNLELSTCSLDFHWEDSRDDSASQVTEILCGNGPLGTSHRHVIRFVG